MGRDDGGGGDAGANVDFSGIKVVESNGVKVYQVTGGGREVPRWMT